MTDTKTTDTWEGLEGRDRFAACLVEAQQGNREALDVLVADLNPLVWHVARGNELDRETAAVVLQTVWFTLLVNLERIDPNRVVTWLITTTRREAKESFARTAGQVESSPSVLDEEQVLRAEQQRQLWRAFNQLSSRCQELLRMTVLAGRTEYRAVAEALHMPHGSIGPTRGRCLNNLRSLYQREVETGSHEDPPSDVSALDFLLDEKIPAANIPRKWPPEPDSQTFQVSIYLGDETSHERVEATLETLLQTAGLDLVERDDPITGSWFQRMRARTRDAANSPIARESIAVAAHAIESHGVLTRDATVTATLMQNLGPLLTSLETTKDAVLRVGALLIVKVDWTIAVHQLTSVQQLRLDHQPQLLTSPGDILHALGLSPSFTTQAKTSTNGKVIPSVIPVVEPGSPDCTDGTPANGGATRQHQRLGEGRTNEPSLGPSDS